MGSMFFPDEGKNANPFTIRSTAILSSLNKKRSKLCPRKRLIRGVSHCIIVAIEFLLPELYFSQNYRLHKIEKSLVHTSPFSYEARESGVNCRYPIPAMQFYTLR